MKTLTDSIIATNLRIRIQGMSGIFCMEFAVFLAIAWPPVYLLFKDGFQFTTIESVTLSLICLASLLYLVKASRYLILFSFPAWVGNGTHPSPAECISELKKELSTHLESKAKALQT